MERKQHIPVFIGCAVLLLLLLTVVFVLFFSPKDVSANHSGSQRVFGATYMTMNNPYYQELDALLRSNIEARGDVLLTRDPAMDQARQNQEILDRIDRGIAGVEPPPKPKPNRQAAATPFQAVKGKYRKPGTGCVSQINDHLWEGRYSPKVNGKRIARNIYAPTEAECEEKLAALIAEMKQELALLRAKKPAV